MKNSNCITNNLWRFAFFPLYFNLTLPMGGLISRRRQHQQQQRRKQSIEKGDLHAAIEHSFPSWIKELVKEGADVNRLNSDGDTPLMVAIQRRDLKCAQELIDCGADVNALSSIHYTAMNYASQQDSGECLEFLIKTGADVNFSDYLTPLMTAARDGKDKNVVTLIKAGAHVNKTRRTARQTAFSDAVREGHFKCVKVLIEAGADVNSTTNRCNTALDSAAWADNIEIAKLLLKVGIKLNFRNEYGHNAIESYIRGNKNSGQALEFIMLLFAAGETLPRNAAHIVTKHQYGSDITEIHGFLQELLKPDFNLMDICRRAIREHLMNLSNVNLFVRIPELGLPAPLLSFLLYYVDLYAESVEK